MMQKFQGKVLDIKAETSRVKTVRITWPGIEHFTFIPGQFMQFGIPGVLNKAGGALKRSYSIANAPLDKGFVEFTVIPKTPDGLGAKVHELKPGDTVTIDGPAGFFALKRPVRDNTTFVAGGTGIASLRCMYRQLLLEGFKGPLWLLAGFHAPEDIVYREELAALQREHPNFKVIESITVEDPHWKGQRGRVTELIPKLFKDAPSRDWYLCGPPAMVEDTIKVLTELGVPRHQINREVW